MKNQVYNPYLPPWEFVPDAEPRVFQNRLYVFGSHDRLCGKWYCENDYVAWSCPVDNLSDWRFDGVIFEKKDAPRKGNLFAPDVAEGPDGKFYLYFSKDDSSVIGVAVCDSPAGRYKYIGEVSYPDGKILGDDEGEYFMFDPSVLIDEGRIWLYSGSSKRETTSNIKRIMAGCTVTELESDMLTVKTPPKVVLPGDESWEADTYFEGPSARKIGKLYYIVYPVRNSTGLHYAVSKYPDRDFLQRGRIHSSSDIGLNGHSLHNPAYPLGNSHGGLIQLNGKWYIFDHRMTESSVFSRQGVAEPVTIEKDGSIKQAESTSCGLNGAPLRGSGTYPAYIACCLTAPKRSDTASEYEKSPFIKRDGADGEHDTDSYISDIRNGCTAGFKYFDFAGGLYRLSVTLRGGTGELFISTKEDGAAFISRSKLRNKASLWQKHTVCFTIPHGTHALFFTYRGDDSVDMLDFSIEKMQNEN